MIWNIKDSGDPFEQKCYNLISSKIKKYNDFWSTYVGNIGGKPASIKGLSRDLDTKRLLVAQWNYTFLRNVFTTDVLIKRNDNKQVKNQLDLINQEIDFLLSTHLFFNTIEIVDKINSHIEIQPIKQNFNAFIEFRNHLTHNIKPLIKVSNNYYHVPLNFDWFENINIPTNESWIWSEFDFSSLKFQRLSTYFQWCFENSLNLFNQTLDNELKYFSNNLKGLKISEFEPEIKSNKNELKPSSGTTKQ